MGGGPGARARRGRGRGEVRWCDLPGPAIRLVMEHLARAGGGGPAAEVATGAEAEGRSVPHALYTMGRVCVAWRAEVRDYLMGDTAASRRKRKWVAARSGGGRHSSGAGLALCAEGRSNSEESESVGALPHGGAPLESGGLDSRSVDSPRPRGQASPLQPPRQRARMGYRLRGRNGPAGGSIPTESAEACPGVGRGSPGAEHRGGGSSCGAQVVSGAGGHERGMAFCPYLNPSSLTDDSDDEVAWGGLEAPDRTPREALGAGADADDPGRVARAGGIPDEPPLVEADPNEARGGNRLFRRLLGIPLQGFRWRMPPAPAGPPTGSPSSSDPTYRSLD